MKQKFLLSAGEASPNGQVFHPGFILQPTAGPPPCSLRESEIRMVTAGASPGLFFSPSHHFMHAAPVFPFKFPLQQLLAWDDISGKCEEMAAEAKP
jgi:hypothetical protein